MRALEIYVHILSVMWISIFGINNKAIPIYKREFIRRLGLIYEYTWFILRVEMVYSIVEYYVHTIRTSLNTLYICIHTLEHGTFIDYSHNKNKSKKVRTMIWQSPLSPHLRGISLTATGLRSIPNYSPSRGLQSFSNYIAYGIFIEQISWFRKLDWTMISNLIYLHNSSN